MKFKEWATSNRPVFKNDKIIITVFKHGSLKREDRILKASVNFDMSEKIFGDFEVVCFKPGEISSPDDGYRSPGIEVFLWNDKSETAELIFLHK